MPFSFIHISDHHLMDSEQALLHGFSPAHSFQAVLQRIARDHVGQFDFLVTTGDIVEPGSAASYRTFLRLIGLPEGAAPAVYPGPLPGNLDGVGPLLVYCLPGNHDDRVNFYQVLFPQSQPGVLANGVFQHKGIQFICLDMGPASKAAAHPQTIDFLVRSLQAGQPSIILLHHPVTPIGSRWLDAFLADDIGRFWQAVAGQRVMGIFCGHTHIPYEKQIHGIPVFGVRSTAFPFLLQDEPLAALLPPQYRLVTVSPDGLSSQVFEIPL